MKKMFSELKDFLFRGNILDLAVAVVIGAAFKAIVDSLVSDIITPIIGAIFNVQSFESLTLGVIRIGSFIDNVISFLIIGVSLFVIVKAAETLTASRKAKEETAEEIAAPTQEELLAEIRDLLKVK